MMQYFEWNLPNDGTFWIQLKNDAKHLSEIGVTSVWIPPAYKADEQEDEGYSTYDLFDLGEFDQKNTVRTKYGTKGELVEAINELHKYQICVYLDAVMNHKAGADYTERFMVQEVDPENRDNPISEPYEIEGRTGYDFPGRGNKYSDFKWNSSHFSGTDKNEADGRCGIYRILGQDKYWSQRVNGENGNYDYLIRNDLDLNHPDVVKELNHWGKWVSRELQLDGMRLDAIKHMDDNFIKQFLDKVRAERGDNFYVVGEYWKGDFGLLKSYLEFMECKLDLFDVPLHFKMFQASCQGRDFDFTGFWDDTLVSNFPENAVTFVDNHDSQCGSSLESEIESWFKPQAYGLILLMEKGYPCIFYGDYYRIGDQDSPHRTIIDILLGVRQKYAYGDENSYFDHCNTAGFTRMGDDDHPGSGLALLLSNGDDGDKVMYVGEHHKDEVWYDVTGSIDDEVTIGDDGQALFKVRGGRLAVWIKK
ncbi:hypothetical protein HMPREF9455_00609 [Dysgonomonas gadei ATCC BAA-286]|uniref:Glycosyl hydrolase family 13 catalytic domain-containing protein n=2 Tax=Dysgonomonadaceae TaxID=2005520 RepID=F5IU42_9BACT|nr:hypothetical protein HMPREF9455_00609 [Dysgonomonas gadei ATCC BAA-286]